MSCRPGGLAYVVAFANKGAKDVTQRYVGSVLAADKMRDNVWWEQTLKPLRKHEVCANCKIRFCMNLACSLHAETLHHIQCMVLLGQGHLTQCHTIQVRVACAMRTFDIEGSLTLGLL